MTAQSDRVAGVAALLIALAIAVKARTFTVEFLTDPLGPRALPLFAAALLAGGGLFVALKPEADPSWPDAAARARAAAAGLSFLAYAWLLPWLGFVLATALESAVLARVFGGRIVHCVAAGMAISGALYAVFGWALGLALPAGLLLAGLAS